MNKIVIAVIVIAVLVILGGYFLVGGRSAQPNPPAGETANEPTAAPLPAVGQTPAKPLPSSTVPADKKNVVIYRDGGYSPSTLEIKQGETVVFQNQSSAAMWTASAVHPTHRLYSGTSLSEHCGSPAEKDSFDACRGIQPGESWSFQFNKKGTWQYHNHLNATHTGTIVVK